MNFNQQVKRAVGVNSPRMNMKPILDKNKNCVGCGKVFYAKYKGHKYCSSLCKMENGQSKEDVKARERRNALLFDCVGCGKTIQRKTLKQIYCGKQCREKSYYKAKGETIIDVVCENPDCGKLFQRKTERSRGVYYCSKFCANHHRHLKFYNPAAKKEKRQEKKEKAIDFCCHCGKEMERDGRRFYCSKECRRNNYNKGRKEKLRIKVNKLMDLHKLISKKIEDLTEEINRY